MYTFKSLKRRIIAVLCVIVIASFGLVARLFYLQIAISKNLQSKALDQWMRDLPLAAQRGNICDRNGVVLASSYSVYDIYVKPVLVKNTTVEASVYSEILGLEIEEVTKKISDRTTSEVNISKNATKLQIEKLLALGVNSFVATENWEREYLYGDFLSQILGFVSSDGIGQSGIEFFITTICLV